MFRNKIAVGLDIGPNNSKLVRLVRKGKTYHIKAIAQAHLSNEFADTDPTACIKQCFVNAGLKPKRTKKLVCGLFGSDVTVNRFDFPEMSEEELEQAIYYEASQICPYNIDRCVIDYSVQNTPRKQRRKRLAENPERIKGITVVARKQAMDDRVKLLKRAGTGCAKLDVHGLALLNCIDGLEYGGSSQTYAAVSLNEHCTTVAVKLHDGTCILRELSDGIEVISGRISEQFGLNTFQVLQRFDHASPLDKQFQKMLSKGSQELLSQIAETVKFSSSQGSNSLIQRMYLCGPRGITEAFSLLLEAISPYHIIVWNPLDKVRIPRRIVRSGFPDRLRGASAIAIGMAMRMV